MSDANLYFIPSRRAFADGLAEGFLRRFGADLDMLARSWILLPNRRSVRQVQQAFAQVSTQGVTLLPRIMAIGDVGLDELVMASGGDPRCFDMLPAVSEEQQQIQLFRYVKEWSRLRGEGWDQSQCFRQAEALIAFWKMLGEGGVSEAALHAVCGDNFTAQWHRNLRLHDYVKEKWTAYLGSVGRIDPWERQHQVTLTLIELWKKYGVKHPVVIAGTTGTIHSTRLLINNLIHYKNGYYIAVGPGEDIPPDVWRMLPEHHPHYAIKQLLDYLTVEKSALRPWVADETERKECVWAEVMYPAEEVHRWRAKKLSGEEVSHIAWLEAQDMQQEVEAVAVLMREALEHKDFTCALVTEDRALASYVLSYVKRWRMQPDDSEGVRFCDLPQGHYLRLLLCVLEKKATTEQVLALFKHIHWCPVAERDAWARAVEWLDGVFLRREPIQPDIKLWKDKLRRSDEQEDRAALLREVMDKLIALQEQLASLFDKSAAPTKEVILFHKMAAEQLSIASGPGASLWKNEAGERIREALKQAAEELENAVLPDVDAYAAWFAHAMSSRRFRASQGYTPNLFVLTPLEARLLSFDRVILAALNEGIWPAYHNATAWLPPQAMRSLGLPTAEFRKGQSAHDFVQCASNGEVFLTSSLRREGKPVMPSPWLLRLRAYLEGKGALDEVKRRGAAWLSLASEYRKSGIVPQRIERPAPQPPVDARPTEFSVTDIGRWMHNPYYIYGKYILRLRALDALRTEPSGKDRGNWLHQALEQFIEHYDKNERDPLARLLRIMETKIGALSLSDAARHTLRNRWRRIARWLVSELARQDALVSERRTEVTLEQSMANGQGEIRLRGRIDRVDIMDNDVAILDYKTAESPSKSAIRKGLEPQLALNALLWEAQSGKPLPVGALSYWELKGYRDIGVIHTLHEGAAAHALDYEKLKRHAKEGLTRLTASFMQKETPYHVNPHPAYRLAYDDYRHLSREKEWSVFSGETETAE